jgi:hypothetical protein
MTLFAKNSGGNWSSASTWSNISSASADSSGPPTAADDVVINSGSGNITIDATSVCRSLDCNTYTGTLTHNGFTLSIGDTTPGTSNIALRLSAGMTYITSNTTLFFKSTSSTQQTINTGGKPTASITINGAGSNYQLASDITLTTANWSYVTGTTFDANGKTITMALSSGAARSFAGGGQTYYGLTSTIPNTTLTITDNNTFTNLNVTATTNTAILSLPAATTVTGTLTLAGTSATIRLLVNSPAIGTTATITNTSATMTWSYLDCRDIALTSSYNAAAITGLSGDCGGNSNITFTTASTQTATGTASLVWSTHGWTTRVPLPQDNVIVNNAFVASRSINIDMPRAGKSVIFGCTGAPQMSFTANGGTTFYGSLDLTGINVLFSGSTNFEGRGAYAITTAGLNLAATRISAYSGSITLQDAYTSTSTLTIDSGIFDANSFSVTVSVLSSTTNNTRTITMGSGIWTLTGTGGIWNLAGTGLTFNANTANIVINNTTATGKSFTGNSLTYNDVTFIGDAIAISGNNTFGTVNINTAGYATGLRTTGLSTQTIGNITTNGSSGNLAIFASSNTSPATIVKPASGNYVTNYMSLSYLTLSPTNSPIWYAGANSVDGGNNTNITFTNPPPVGTSIGIATASGVGRSLFSATGSAIGVAATSTIGRLLFSGTGLASGVASVNGVGAYALNSVGLSAGNSIVGGFGQSLFAVAAVSSGSAAANYIGKSNNATIATAIGSATTNVIGLSLISSVVSASGLAVVFGQSGMIASTNGLATIYGQSGMVANANGLAISNVIGAGISAARASADGQAVIYGQIGMTASADGLAVPNMVASSIANVSFNVSTTALTNIRGAKNPSDFGIVTGLAIANFKGASLVPGAGSSNGLAVVKAIMGGIGSSNGLAAIYGQAGMIGKANGLAVANIVGSSLAKAMALSTAIASTNIIGSSLAKASSSIIGLASTNFIGQAIFNGLASSAGIATIYGQAGMIGKANGFAGGATIGASLFKITINTTGIAITSFTGSSLYKGEGSSLAIANGLFLSKSDAKAIGLAIGNSIALGRTEMVAKAKATSFAFAFAKEVTDSDAQKNNNFTNKNLMSVCEIIVSMGAGGRFIYKVTITKFDSIGMTIPFTGSGTVEQQQFSYQKNIELKLKTAAIPRSTVFDRITQKDIKNFLFDITGSAQVAKLTYLSKQYQLLGGSPMILFDFE